MGVDWGDSRLIAELHMRQRAVVKVNNKMTEATEIGRGVKQKCLILPSFFNVYAEAIMREALDGVDEGIKVVGEFIRALRFTDDQAMTANSERGLQNIMNETNGLSKNME